MTPDLARAIGELERRRIEGGSSFAKRSPEIAAAIDRVLREARKGKR